MMSASYLQLHGLLRRENMSAEVKRLDPSQPRGGRGLVNLQRRHMNLKTATHVRTVGSW